MRRNELLAGSAVSLLLLASLGTLAVYHRREGGGRVVLEEALRDVVKHQKAIIAKETALIESVEHCGKDGGYFVKGTSNEGAKVSCLHAKAAAKHQHAVLDEHKEWCEAHCYPVRVKEESCTHCVQPSFPEYMAMRKKTEHSNWGITIPHKAQIIVPHPSLKALTSQSLATSMPEPPTSPEAKRKESTLQQAMAFYKPYYQASPRPQAMHTVTQSLATSWPSSSSSSSPASLEDARRRVQDDVARLEHDEEALTQERVHADLALAAAGAHTQTRWRPRMPRGHSRIHSRISPMKHFRGEAIHPMMPPHVAEERLRGRVRRASAVHRQARHDNDVGGCHDISSCLSSMLSSFSASSQFPTRGSRDEKLMADSREPAVPPAYRHRRPDGLGLRRRGVNVAGWRRGRDGFASALVGGGALGDERVPARDMHEPQPAEEEALSQVGGATGGAVEGGKGGGFEDERVAQHVSSSQPEVLITKRVPGHLTPLEHVGQEVENAGAALGLAAEKAWGALISDRPTSAGHKLSHFTQHGGGHLSEGYRKPKLAA